MSRSGSGGIRTPNFYYHRDIRLLKAANTGGVEMAMIAPMRVTPQKLGDYLEVMTKAVFQSGMSWKVVDAKWPGFHEVFGDFDPERLAELSPDDVDRIAQDTRVIRNRRKIEATVHNAATMLAVDREFKGFKNYLKSQHDFETLSRDLIKRFKFLGATGAYVFLYGVGEPVPEHCEPERPPS
jgi:3-methyladenine DNA glycosylase Tag